ncbi:uncharacterized protein LOC105650363 isoform X2 [Jatropha curcas]|uniref:uncharacterized protein LOC105650363 isoform X2 n=1 Tax=Jatropha curcas TaxID=180498 RepID=UPI0005FC015C|nr:uncharacterized protein LOC105650363 isoform X2 [Jatropha curcas]
MKSKHNQIRVFGQRSIPSSFIFGSSNSAKDSKDDLQKKGLNKNSSISLSDFLDEKLQTNSVLPKIVKGKSRPFKSPVGPKDDGGSIDHWIAIKKKEKETNSVVDQVIFEQFKHTSADKVDGIGSCADGRGAADGAIGTSSALLGIGSSHVLEIGTSNSNNEQETRKRRNPFEEPKQKVRSKRFLSNKKARPLYNHYANGCGWWDCGMEGVDSEEVGFGEIWEGVGSTTFGGIEWH